MAVDASKGPVEECDNVAADCCAAEGECVVNGTCRPNTDQLRPTSRLTTSCRRRNPTAQVSLRAARVGFG